MQALACVRRYDPVIPVRMFERQLDTGFVSKSQTEDEKTLSLGKALHCTFCYSIITWQASAIERPSQHNQRQHIQTFINPGGYEFTLGCFARANCLVIGTPTKEWSWFLEYHWQYALCPECQEHLGWYYQSTTISDSFYGLIIDRLVSDSGHH